MTFVLVARGEVCRMRAAKPERNAEALRVADRDIGSKFSRRFQQRQRQEVGCHHDKGAGGMRPLYEVCIIVNCAIGGGILDKRAENGLVELILCEIADLNLDAERLCACLHNSNRLWVTIVGDKKRFAIRDDRMTKRHRFGGGRGFIKQRRIGNLERCQVGDHRLEVEEGFESTLRELRLVGCVSRVPARVLQYVSLDHWRRNAIGIATTDE